jgi:hypothetical protein
MNDPNLTSKTDLNDETLGQTPLNKGPCHFTLKRVSFKAKEEEEEELWKLKI